MRRRAILGAVAVTLSGTAAVAAVALLRSDESAATATTAAPRSTAPVTRGDLIETDEVTGTVDHATAVPLRLPLAGTLTAVPEVGTVIAPGDRIVEVDGRPVLAVPGVSPYWRDLGAGMGDGKDVLQLEYYLASEGYGEGLTVDEQFTSATTRAVKAFQRDHGLPRDGVLSLGEIVVVDGPQRVDAIAGRPGDAAAEAGLAVTPPDQQITVSVAPDDADQLPLGAVLPITLAGGTARDATVTAIGDPVAGDDGDVTQRVTLVPTAPLDVADGTSVDVTVVVAEARDALSVPVESIVALAEGGYAVETVTGSGTALVRVELGRFIDGQVVVEGELDEGSEVVVP